MAHIHFAYACTICLVRLRLCNLANSKAMEHEHKEHGHSQGTILPACRHGFLSAWLILSTQHFLTESRQQLVQCEVHESYQGLKDCVDTEALHEMKTRVPQLAGRSSTSCLVRSTGLGL